MHGNIFFLPKQAEVNQITKRNKFKKELKEAKLIQSSRYILNLKDLSFDLLYGPMRKSATNVVF